MFSARRPHGDSLVMGTTDETKKEEGATSKLELKNSEFPPYDAVIPHLPSKYLSYGLNLVDLKKVKAFPTRLESTTQIVAYGFDIFFVRVSPESNFDLL